MADRSTLVTLGIVLVVFLVAYLLGVISTVTRMRQRVRDIRRDTARRQRAVVGGLVSEQLAPYLPGFPYRGSEARFIGKPVDFLVFVGMDEKRIEKIVFVEVKTGRSRLSDQERNLKKAVEEGRVEWLTYRPDAS